MSVGVDATQPAAANISEIEKRTVAKAKRYLYVYFIIGMIFMRMDAYNIGFAQLTMSKELAISSTVFGLAAGIFALSSFLSQVPASMAFEKFGARSWLTFTMIAWGLTCSMQAFVHSKTELVLLRFLTGVFEAGFQPGLFVLINIWFKGRSHGLSAGCIQLGAAGGGVIGGPFAGWILGTTFFGLSGWRNLFLFEGGATVVFALLAIYIVTSDPKTAHWLKPDEREFMSKYVAANQVEKAAQGAIEKTGLWGILKDTRILMLAFCIFCAGWSASTFLSFMPILLKTAGKGVSNQTVGFLVMVPYIVNVIVAFGWGAHGDKYNERHYHTTGAIVVAVAGMLLFPLATSSWVALLAIVLVNAGNTGLFVNYWATVTTVMGRKTIAKTMAVCQGTSMIGNFVGPIVFGFAMDVTHTKSVGIYICAGVMTLNFIVLNIFFFRYKAQQRKAQRDGVVVAS